MGTFSNQMIAVAQKLLTKYGQAITAKHDVVSSSDVTTGMVTEDPDEGNYSGVGYPSNYKDSQIDGTLIRAGDIKLILRTTEVPAMDDVITISGRVYTALNIQFVTAQGDTVIHKIQCRAS